MFRDLVRRHQVGHHPHDTHSRRPPARASKCGDEAADHARHHAGGSRRSVTATSASPSASNPSITITLPPGSVWRATCRRTPCGITATRRRRFPRARNAELSGGDHGSGRSCAMADQGAPWAGRSCRWCRGSPGRPPAGRHPASRAVGGLQQVFVGFAHRDDGGHGVVQTIEQGVWRGETNIRRGRRG